MNRKTQVEKFQAKYGVKKKDEQVIKEKQIKKTIQEKGAEIARNKNVNTEDVFAVIGKDSVDTFVKMWNNSMETVIKETIREEIKPLIREIVREELISAFTGISRGLAGDIKIEIETPTVSEETVEEEAQVIEEPEDFEELYFYDELREHIHMAKVKGIDPYMGSKFKKLSSRANGLYQTFAKHHKGRRGSWKRFVKLTLND